MVRATHRAGVGAVFVGVLPVLGPTPIGAHHATVDSSAAVSTTPDEAVGQLVDLGRGRALYLECAGDGSPTILLEAGDTVGSGQWQPVFATLADETRTCAYDRAGIGRSTEAAGCRGVDELLGDLEWMLAAADIAAPYLLVGTSGGGYLMAGFAARHPSDVAGLVLLETPKAITISSLPPGVRADIACDSPNNVERRDYIAVEHDVWDARAEIGDFPMTIVSNDYGSAAPPGDERTNVVDQQTWLVLSPNSRQVVVTSGHDVVRNEPGLVIDVILHVLAAARGSA